MKKFLIGIIFIIPVIVVLAMSAAGRIISGSIPVNAVDLSLRDSGNVEIIKDVPLVMNIEDTVEFVIIELLPTITNQTVLYEIDEDVPDSGDLELVRVEGTNRYRIVPKKSGMTRIIVRAFNNYAVYKTFMVEIKETKLKNIKVYGEDGNQVESLTLTAPVRLYADIYPIDALSNNDVEWGSDDPFIARVTSNGTVYPVSVGITRIWVSAMDTTGIRHTQFITVNTKNCIASAPVLYSSGAVDGDWLYNNALINKGADITSLGNGDYSASMEDRSAPFKVLPCSAGDWEMNETPGLLYTNNGPFFLGASYKDAERKDEPITPVFTVSDFTVARIVKGYLLPLKAGHFELAGTWEGISKTYQIEVRERPKFFNLQLNSEDARKGIKMDRLFGLNWFDQDNRLINTYQFGCNAPEGSDILWEVSDSSLASISEDALITFFPASAGKQVIVSATVMVNNYRTALRRSFVFKIAEDSSAINAYDTDQFFRVIDEHYNCPVVMQGNINITRSIDLSAPLFGNGFLIDAKGWQNIDRYTRFINLYNDRLNSYNSEKTFMIEDVVMEGAPDYESSVERGEAINIDCVDRHVVLKNVIIRYVTICITLNRANDVLLEGSIIGDCYFTPVQIIGNSTDACSIVMRNNIFKESIGPSMIFINTDITEEHFNVNCFPDFKIEGFMDIYNWKKSADMSYILSTMDPGILSAFAQYIEPENLYRTIGETLKSIFLRDDYAYLSYRDPKTGEKYYCAGMLALGLYSKVDPAKMVIEDKGLVFLPFTFPTDRTSTGTMIALIETMVKIVNKQMTVLNTNYVLTYNTQADGGPRNKPGDPVPQTKELYERLNSYYAVEPLNVLEA